MKKFQTAFFSLLLMGVTLPGWAKPNHLVLGYSACWFDGIYPPESYNYDALTHIARSFLLPKADGTIISQGGFWDPTLEKMAHAHGVKMIVSLGGAAANADNWLAMSRDAKAEKFFFDNLEKLIVDNHYDGVDIDWEPSALTGADQATYTQFLQNLRKRFPNWIITAALGGGEYWAKHISWTEVAKQVDWINWMTYDYAGSWTGHSGHNANLYAPKNPKVNSDLDIDSNLTNLETKYGVAANKLVLGLPFYGIQFFSEHMGDSFIGDAIKAGAEIQYYEIAPILSGKNYKAFWDEGAQVPYLEKVGGGYIISYDDPKSISLKCDYAVKKGMKGVMIWNLGADLVGDHAVLLDTIAKAYGAPTMTMPASGLTKTVQTFILSLKDVYSKLSAAHDKLVAAGKPEDAKAAEPGPRPDLTTPDSQDVKVLGKRFWELQYALSLANRKLGETQKVLDSLPTKEVAGKKLDSKGSMLLVDNFEQGGEMNKVGGNWTTDCDHNNLGTVMNPLPFKPAAGGSKNSPNYAAHIWGHYGKSMAPWPYTQLNGTLTSGGGAVDLANFKTVEFWVKGDGKEYSLILARAAVEDYCNFRQDFKAGAQWTKVSLNLADFKQPSWGRQLPLKLTDILYLSFIPNADFSDENFDLWMDDVTLVK